MKNGKKKRRHLFDGMKSSTDILANDFSMKRKENMVEISWYNVGVYFNRGFSKTTKNDDERIDHHLQTM